MDDITVKKGEVKYNIEIKISYNSFHFEKSIMKLLDNWKAKDRLNNFILIIVGYMDKSTISEIETSYNIRILDINVIIAALEPFSDLKSTFISLLPFSIKDTDKDISLENYSDIFGVACVEEQSISPLLYINELRKIPSGKEHFSAYEKMCTDILKYLFDDQLSLWRKQTSTLLKLNLE